MINGGNAMGTLKAQSLTFIYRIHDWGCICPHNHHEWISGEAHFEIWFFWHPGDLKSAFYQAMVTCLFLCRLVQLDMMMWPLWNLATGPGTSQGQPYTCLILPAPTRDSKGCWKGGAVLQYKSYLPGNFTVYLGAWLQVTSRALSRIACSHLTPWSHKVGTGPLLPSVPSQWSRS